MKIAVIGAGFTGLTVAYRLTQRGHQVVVFEKETYAGGLSSGIRSLVEDYPPDWEWDLERFYHHWFTNDEAILALVKELGVEDRLIVKRPVTATWYRGRIYPLDSPLSLLRFSPLSLPSRLRTGMVLAYLKYGVTPKRSCVFEAVTADEWLRKWMGEEAYRILWKPLLQGKFKEDYTKINMTWFWARIFKRTPRLVYFKGGFSALIEVLVSRIRQQGGQFRFGSVIEGITPLPGGKFQVFAQEYDRVVVTTPPLVFARLFPTLPKDYQRKLASQQGIGAYVLLLSLSKPFLPERVYWLNINDPALPFLAIVEHTNFMDPSHYGGRHLLYIGDYLPANHPRMRAGKEDLIAEFTPYLKAIRPFDPSTIRYSWFFREPYAQPIVGLNQGEKILPFETPFRGVYLASMAQVYPWDRGTNYAVELGERVARLL